jgi:hypothetical protein
MCCCWDEIEQIELPLWKKVLKPVRMMIKFVVFVAEAPLTVLRTITIPSLGSNEEVIIQSSNPIVLAQFDCVTIRAKKKIPIH